MVTEQDATALLHQAMPLCATLGVRADKYAADEVALTLDWAPALCTTGGILHGGVIMALADSAGAACATPTSTSHAPYSRCTREV